LSRRRLPSVRIDAVTPMHALLASSDLVIVETSSSPTTWAEVIGLDRPMILYCDPDRQQLLPAFAAAIDRACCWCRTPDALASAAQRLIGDPWRVVDELAARDTSAFLNDYVLCSDDGRCVERVASFLETVVGGRAEAPAVAR